MFPRPRLTAPVTLTAVAEAIDAQVRSSSVDPSTVRVSGAALDSRQVQPGDLYAALPGANVHGATFAAGAQRDGAVAILTDEAGAQLCAGLDLPLLVVADPRAALGEAAVTIYRSERGTQRPRLIGITGTNGKTTTSYLLDAALRHLGQTTGLIGTVETRVGDERIKSVRTTPESCDLQSLFAVMAEREIDTCTMEVSSHALSLHRVAGTVFDLAAFLNLSQDHLDFYGDMDSYFQAKALLFTPEHARAGVVVVDSDWGKRLAAQATIPVQTLSTTGEPADWQLTETGELTGPGVRLQLEPPLPGDFNLHNTAVAAMLLLAAGWQPDEVERATAVDPAVPGRMERVRVDAPGAPDAVVDFAHTPQAVTSALTSLRAGATGRIIAVLGAGGDRDPLKRPDMGRAVAAGADLAIITDDNPRSEDPAEIRAAVLSGVAEADREHVREVAGREAAIAAAVEAAQSGDIIVVLGKGHETGQEVAGVVTPFDDRDELRRALTSRFDTDRATTTAHQHTDRSGEEHS